MLQITDKDFKGTHGHTGRYAHNEKKLKENAVEMRQVEPLHNPTFTGGRVPNLPAGVAIECRHAKSHHTLYLLTVRGHCSATQHGWATPHHTSHLVVALSTILSLKQQPVCHKA
jgi:hypothetical protein